MTSATAAFPCQACSASATAAESHKHEGQQVQLSRRLMCPQEPCKGAGQTGRCEGGCRQAKPCPCMPLLRWSSPVPHAARTCSGGPCGAPYAEESSLGRPPVRLAVCAHLGQGLHEHLQRCLAPQHSCRDTCSARCLKGSIMRALLLAPPCQRVTLTHCLAGGR